MPPQTVELSVSDARVILAALKHHKDATPRREGFKEWLEFSIWEATRGKPQKLLIEVVY
jgi:hypothetical protein